MLSTQQELVLTEIRLEAEGIISLVFRHPKGAGLPKWQPGAHLEIALPSGKLRQYSLCSDPKDPKTYRVAVLRVEGGRGGSAEIHDSMRVGQIYTLRGPRNHFALTHADSYLFIAGGIGITPILPMIKTLKKNVDWRAIYCGRSQSSMAFLPSLVPENRVRILSDDCDGRPDFLSEISACAPSTRVYCCGPNGMLDAVVAACATRPDITLCTERFAAGAIPPILSAVKGHSTEVHLAQSGITVTVGPNETILQAVLRVKPDTPWSCQSGFCGTCETSIIEGEVDHLDQLHSDAERQANKTMMICVSRARSPRLVLDL